MGFPNTILTTFRDSLKKNPTKEKEKPEPIKEKNSGWENIVRLKWIFLKESTLRESTKSSHN
jgi:hypothetical protein